MKKVTYKEEANTITGEASGVAGILGTLPAHQIQATNKSVR